MAKFCELGVESDVVIGKGIDIEDLFGRRILIEKVIIQPTKFPGKNSSGLRMQMQVVLATFNEEADKDGDFYTKNPDGTRQSRQMFSIHLIWNNRWKKVLGGFKSCSIFKKSTVSFQ